MAWLMILGLAAASSIDNLGVGISYGIRKIRIGLLSNSFIAAICFLFSMSGILFGQWISTILPGILPTLLATFILLVVGVRIVLLTVPRSKRASAPDTGNIGLEGLISNPEKADLDRSGNINLIEAAILGVALSANALTNGLSAGLIGLSPIAISLTAAIGSFITLWLGAIIGQKVANIRIGSFTVGQFSTVLSGAIIIVVAFNAWL
ncbi:sporulation membrane protein YtaF [Paenibacillus sp. MER TA 81-3]|uniref:sporulation membrane protein YtaF n=1 Tax=Paenibacillus sp. MER TA 81-3 TaxID=2939573 RepID=UPI002040FA17|nr:sporulation membrane protein YtaF [Paenibacillus sp. MER TA 81-3]MCM3339757.1 sporulation membrane protein YtaF [Paenibacillus sp. MER TA 81-3]